MKQTLTRHAIDVILLTIGLCVSFPSSGAAQSRVNSTDSFVDSEILPKLKWSMTISQIRSLGGKYAIGKHEEFMSGTGTWRYKFDRVIEQFGTYGSFTYTFPNQYEPKGFVSVSFAECKTPVMRNNELSKSLDCSDLQRRVMKYFQDRYGKPSITKERNSGGGTDITYTWHSDTSTIELFDLGGLTMDLSFSPK